MIRTCELPCPGNNCADMLTVEITIERKKHWDGHGSMYRRQITDYPNECRSCGTRWVEAGVPAYDPETLQATFNRGNNVT